MPNQFFSNFPIIRYNGALARNLMVRSVIVPKVLQTYTAYYPYVISGDERADMVAHRYYGSSDLVWVVYMSNNITDPYYEWPLTSDDFYAYLVEKYGTYESTLTEVHHYKYNPDVDTNDLGYDYKLTYEMAPETYDNLSTFDKGYWLPVYIYDYEEQVNEAKRNIKLLDRRFIPQLIAELEKIYK